MYDVIYVNDFHNIPDNVSEQDVSALTDIRREIKYKCSAGDSENMFKLFDKAISLFREDKKDIFFLFGHDGNFCKNLNQLISCPNYWMKIL